MLSFVLTFFLCVTCSSSILSVLFPLVNRYTVGEHRLAQETPPVMSSARPPGRLLLLTVRNMGRPRTLRPLPQSGHQEKFHSLTPPSPPLSPLLWRGRLRGHTAPNESGPVRWTCLCSHHKQDPL